MPKSDTIVSNVTNSKPGSVELEREEFDMGRSKLNGGKWNDGTPDLISPRKKNLTTKIVSPLHTLKVKSVTTGEIERVISVELERICNNATKDNS